MSPRIDRKRREKGRKKGRMNFSRSKNFLEEDKRADQLCNRGCRINDSAYAINRLCRVIGQRLVRGACSSDVKECRNLLFDANSICCHPARLLFPLRKDATTITHLHAPPQFSIGTWRFLDSSQTNRFIWRNFKKVEKVRVESSPAGVIEC